MSTNDLKIVLIGETGIGKSQLGNFILNNTFFEVVASITTEKNKITVIHIQKERKLQLYIWTK